MGIFYHAFLIAVPGSQSSHTGNRAAPISPVSAIAHIPVGPLEHERKERLYDIEDI